MQAYHFGPKYLVELEMMMPDDTPLRRSHDCGIELQHSIEKQLAKYCERCFVHIDYETRIGEDGRSIDHDPSVPLEKKLGHDGSGSLLSPASRQRSAED